MPTYTTRLGMTKPSGTAAPEEPVDVNDINDNMDRIDEGIGNILVNDGVTPADADLFDGAVVEEKTSRKIWRAKTNGSGGFTKVWIRWPYMGVFYRNAGTLTSGTSFQEKGFDDIASGAVNATSAQLTAAEWVCPLTGIWSVKASTSFTADAAGYRGLAVGIDSARVTDTGQSGPVTSPGAIAMSLTAHWQDYLTAGQTVSVFLVQNSGSSLTTNHRIQVTMIDPFHV